MDEYPIEIPETTYPLTDWFLQQLVAWANDRAMEYGVTLHVGGLAITGTLINGRTYFEEIAKLLAGAVTIENEEEGGGRSNLQEAIAGMGRIYPEREYIDRLEAGEDISLPNQPSFIHLRDAHWLVGTQVVPTEPGIYWRGRISAVDGFVLGTISVTHVP